MKWNLRLTAANRGIWKASELQRLLADRGLVVSAGKVTVADWPSATLAASASATIVVTCRLDMLLRTTKPDVDDVVLDVDPADDGPPTVPAIETTVPSTGARRIV